MSATNDAVRETLVWDRGVRVFHWSLVVCVALAWATGEADGFLFQVHLWSGYAVLALVVFRIAWGFLGGRHALFTSFIRRWPDVRSHLASVLKLSPERHVGHNPIGGWMILALLSVLTLMVATGLFSTPDGGDGTGGPFAGFVGAGASGVISGIHEGLSSGLLVLIVIHLAGVLGESVLCRENLVRAMWSGRKRGLAAPGAVSAEEPAVLRLAVAASLAVILVGLLAAAG